LVLMTQIFLENLTLSQLVTKFPAVNGTRRFITVLTTAHQFSLSRVTWSKVHALPSSVEDSF